jgi:hypothetical protein
VSQEQAVGIIVRLVVPFATIPNVLVQAASQFLFECFKGQDTNHDARWRRLWRSFAEGTRDSMHLWVIVGRSGKFHRRHMAIENDVFELQDCFEPTAAGRKAFRWWLKTGAAFGHYEASNGKLVFVPDSTSYEECDDAKMREFHEAAMEFLRQPHALKHLWPQVARDQRLAMLEAAIAGDPETRP